jgi:hypothetical protein
MNDDGRVPKREPGRCAVVLELVVLELAVLQLA